MPAKQTLLIVNQSGGDGDQQHQDHGNQCKVDREREDKKQQPSNKADEEGGGEEEDMVPVDNDAGKDDGYSDGPPSSNSEENSEFLCIELSEIHKIVQCPICLGIIKRTRTVMECLHRFCGDCIDKAMRLGNNECPACRKHCASRRSLRDDPRFDTLIAALYPNIDQYEEEELAFREEDRSRNQQIQASIAQVSYQQSEALVKRRSLGKQKAYVTGPQRNEGNTSKRKRNPTFEDPKDDNYDNGRRGRSSDEQGAIFRPYKGTKHLASLPSSSVVIKDVNCLENDSEASKERRGTSLGHAWKGGLLAWGKGCTRSPTSHGSSGGSSGRSSRARFSRLMKHMGSLKEREELDVHLKLEPSNGQSVLNLSEPFIYCVPSFLVKELRQYVAVHLNVPADAIKLCIFSGRYDADKGSSSTSSVSQLRFLEDQQTLADLKSNRKLMPENYMIVEYRYQNEKSNV